MNPYEVGRSYDRIAHHWDGGKFDRQDGLAQHERAIAFTELRGRALDIGCGGSGRIIDLLRAHGFAPEGVDISSGMLELARRRHPEIAFHHADICSWVLPTTYDFISAWDSIWHVPLDAHEAVLAKVLAALNPGGVAIFTIGGTEAPSEMTNVHMGPPMYYSTLGLPRTLQVIGQAGAVCRHLEYDQYPELHVCVTCQRKARDVE